MKILLDPGHGENTLGKRSPDKKLLEYKWNREIANMVKNKLPDYDVEIIVPELRDISLGERVRRVNNIAKKEDCILFSIHANAAGNGTKWMNAKGWEVHISINASGKSKKIANLLYDSADEIKRKTRKPLPNQKYWVSNFYILKYTNCPAVLVESGFYDNKEDCEYLLSSKGKEESANIIASSIIKYIKQCQL